MGRRENGHLGGEKKKMLTALTTASLSISPREQGEENAERQLSYSWEMAFSGLHDLPATGIYGSALMQIGMEAWKASFYSVLKLNLWAAESLLFG